MNPLKNKYDIGVIIGRFQVPDLSEGHHYIIKNIIESHFQTIILLGVSQALGSKKNPLGYTARMQMIRELYPDVIIAPIIDVGSDEVWSKNVDLLVRSLCPIGSVCLYGGRNSFIKSYHGIYPTFEIGSPEKLEGTQIREDVGKEVINSVDFRKGVIYGNQNQYSKVFLTVDIAVVRKDKVLMARRSGSDLYRFPGGFVDPCDSNLEEAAIRELIEEIDIEVDKDSVKYIGSNRQEDWRYSYPDEVITTALFSVNYVFGSAKTKEEFEDTKWIDINIENLPKIEGAHKKLFEIMCNHYG